MLLASIRDLNPELYPEFPTNPDTRITTRAVLYDADGNIAVMHIGKKGYHKLAGGGVEGNETLEQALTRELLEETGCTARIIKPLGRVEEYRARGGFLQISHAYIAKVVGAKGQPAFDADEQADGFSLKWLPPQTALAVLEENAGSPDYAFHFISGRETAILKAALAQ